MAKGGYVGKILFVNLTDKSTKELNTADYEQWGGGHGMGSALFFEFVKDKTIDGFHPDNLLTFMTGPMSGTLAPSASGRTEIQGIGVQQYPTGWFSRSNFGGRFAGMLKYAGFDGIAIQGKSDKPVWLNIVNGKVTFEDASGLWGLDTHETQQEIWSLVNKQTEGEEWYGLSKMRDGGRTTQKPAVACIGPAGENLARSAVVIHDSGNGGGQIGFAAVMGSKNLKAISTLGTGSVPVADPNALMKVRLEIKEKFGYNPDAPSLESPVPGVAMYGIMNAAPGYATLLWAPTADGARPQGCMGCFKNCRMNHANGLANGDICVEGLYWMASGNQEEQMAATTLLDQMGLNVYDVMAHNYLLELYKMGVLGKGKGIDTDLPFDKYNTYEFIEKYTKAIALREGIGNDLAEGITRAAVKWGRYEQDTATGLLNRPQWGFMEHYDPRLEVEWSYGSLFGDRDINEHGVNWHVHWMPLVTSAVGQEPLVSAEELVKLIAEATGVGDPEGWNYSEEGIYADPKLKAVAWHRHYTRVFIQSLLFCDWAWPMLVNYNAGDDHKGASPDFEMRIFNAVTGNDWTYEEAMEVGRKIWNLDRAIWVLQGRHRDQEVFQGYVYDVATSAPYHLPVNEDGKWSYGLNMGRKLDRAKFEDVKDRFYALEGWDPATGWPTRKGLAELGLDNVADELEQNKKLGS